MIGVDAGGVTGTAAQAALEGIRIAVALVYGLGALAEGFCELSGHNRRAGIKPLGLEYLEDSPRLSALVWLCLHALLLTGLLRYFWSWWQPALLMAGFAVFLWSRAFRSLSFRPGR